MAVKGDAFNVIKHLEIRNENYAKARSLLMDRYHHPRKLENAQFYKLYEYPEVETESATLLKKLLDNIKNIVFHMVKKLPKATSTAWEESLGASIELPRMNEFKQFIEKKYRVLEMTEITNKQQKHW